jgi:hypothetical protein
VIINGSLPTSIKGFFDFEREMILGSNFWSGLKGMVFDFGPGSKRVGFVPRWRWVNKNGMLNPFFTPGPTAVTPLSRLREKRRSR